MAEDPGSTNPRWWSLDQTLVWIVLRIEMLPQDAEQIANSPEINPEIEGAWNQLKREFRKSALGGAKDVPIDKFRIPCGRRYTDLLTLFQVPSAEPGALSTAMDLFERDVRWQDVEYYSVWVKRAFPPPAPAVGVAAPTVSAPVPSVPEEAPPPAAHPGAPVAAESEETPVAETPPVSAADGETTASAPVANTEAPVPPLVDAIVTETPAANTALPTNRGGRPTDRDLVLEEAERRLTLEEAERRLKPEEAERRLKRPQRVPKTLRAFSCDLHEWLKDNGEHRVAKTGDVMKAETIEGHVRPLWNAYKARIGEKPL